MTTTIDAAVDQAVDLVARALWQRDGFLTGNYPEKASVYRHAVRTALARVVAGRPDQPDTPCDTCHGKRYDPETGVHLNANPTTPESIEAINSVLDAVLRRFAPCPDCAPLLACGHPDTTPEVHHDHEGQPSCVDCCDKCSPGQGT